MKRFSIALVFLLAVGQAAAKEPFGPYRAEVVRVKDGDTILVDVALWPGLRNRISVRLDGVNTPESRRPAPACEIAAGKQAKEFVRSLLPPGSTVTLSGVRLGKYAGRVLGRIQVDGKDLGEILIARGLAREYHGGRRRAWCTD